MALRYIRNTAVLAKIETTYGTDAVPTGASDALLLSDVRPNPLNAKSVDRALVRPYFGASEQLVGPSFLELAYAIEAAGSGAAGTAPAFGKLMRACGFAEAVTASTRVDYTPVSTGFEALTQKWYDDGVVHPLLGSRGDFDMVLDLGEKPRFDFSFIGLYSAPSAVVNPTVTLTAFQKPVVPMDVNDGDVTLGCTYSAGALVGGTAYPSKGLKFSLGNKVAHVPLLGGESVEITDRQSTGQIILDLTAAQEVAQMASVTGNVTTGIGFQHGIVAGNILLFHAPAAQLVNPTPVEHEGKRLVQFDLRFVPVSGNDECRFVFK